MNDIKATNTTMTTTVVHLEETNSTQEFLIKYLSERNLNNSSVLVSTSRQTQGIGRQGKNWDFYENSLAFSFTIPPATPITLSALEVAVSTVNFFKYKFKLSSLKLKWPNDILNAQNQKCGGILISVINSTPIQLVIGVGINLMFDSVRDQHLLTNAKDYLTPLGFVFSDGSPNSDKIKNQLSPEFKKQIPVELYEHIRANRLNPKDIVSNWHHLCAHNDKMVNIVTEPDNHFSGIFRGINEQGEAIIYNQQTATSKNFLSGTLLICE
ncbi:MAG: biotin--[acetyl-CoA-carboxylase] ligase [Oligoflexia bacterium]|nr:biotin--[acetyl-CoA-carboxylase] ligase [Oligoflexia bacterium]